MANKIIWVDIKTTGLYLGEDKIIEIAALYEEIGYPKSRSVFHRYAKPAKEKPKDWDDLKVQNELTITDFTGITWEKLEKEGLSQNDLTLEFIDFLNSKIQLRDVKDKCIFAAYNTSFDSQFVRKLFNPDADQYFGSYFFSCSLDIISTVALARYKGVLPVLTNYKNITLAEHFNIKLQAHSALSDIKASRAIQLELEKLLGVK